MRDEATTDKVLKSRLAARNALRRGVRRPVVAGMGLALAVIAAAAAWYVTTGSAWWLTGGILAGLALASGALAIVLLVRGGLSSLTAADTGLMFASLDVAANGRAISDAEGRLIYANAAYRAMAGGRAGDPPSPVELAVINEDMAQRLKALLKLARSGGSGKEIVAVDLPDGGRRWLRLAAGDGGADGATIVWKVIDITSEDLEREHALAAVSSLGPVLSAAGLVWVVVGMDGRIVLQSQAAQAVANLGSTLAGIDAGSVITVEDSERGTGKEFIVAAAALFSHDLKLVLLRDAAQSVAVGDGVDERFQRYFAEAPLAIATIDAEGRILDSNDLFSRLLPERLPEMGATLDDVFPDKDAREVAWRVREAVERGIVPPPVDVRLKRDPDRQAQLFVHRAGGDDRLIAYLIDVTEQKNLELQFAQSQKMQAVGQLAGGIAHDFNNLLTAITGFCDLLLVRHGPGDQSFADIMQIKQNANRAANLTRQLLAFSRQQTLRPKVLIVTDVLAELSNLLRRLIGENIDLKMIHGRNLGPVRVDQGQLEQVIINLAVNARDAMPKGGTLTIRTANISTEDSRKLGHTFMPPADYVLVEVADTGIGIPKEHLGKIFEPFFSTKEVGKGTGLGLSTVYGIVKQTGGFIFPISEPGKGATFRIFLPVHRGEEEEKPPTAVDAAPEKPKDLTGKASVLLVEDEDAVRMFASRALKNKGYKVWEAASGEAALEIVAARGDEIDLLISDVVMPNMDGPTLVKAIRERNQRMKIIFISGYAEDAFKKNLAKGEAFSFLPKPFSLKQLAEKVKDVLET